jgi:hypothetical protein
LATEARVVIQQSDTLAGLRGCDRCRNSRGATANDYDFEIQLRGVIHGT